MKLIKSKLLLLAILLSLSQLFITGCSDDGTNPSTDAEVSEKTVSATQSTYDSYESVQSALDMEEMVNPESVGDASEGGVNTYLSVKSAFDKYKEIELVYKQLETATIDIKSVTTDSLIFSEYSATGKTEVYYDGETGMGRIIVVANYSANPSHMVYDSTEIAINMNFTPLLWSDDVITGLSNFKKYEEGFFIASESSEVTFTEWEGTEPVAGHGSQEVVYNESSSVSRVVRTFSSASDGTFSITETVYYSDDTSLERSLVVNSEGSGEFWETRPDGITIHGTFSTFVGENITAQNTITVTFPDGHYIDHVTIEATFVRSLGSPNISGTVNEYVYFSSGQVDSSHVEFTRTYIDNGSYATITITKSNGAHGEFTSTYNMFAGGTLDGWWVDTDGYYYKIAANHYVDSSSEVWVTAWETEEAYSNEQDPMATLHIFMMADGTGHGEITIGGDTYTIVYNGDGTATVTDQNGNVTTVNIY